MGCGHCVHTIGLQRVNDGSVLSVASAGQHWSRPPSCFIDTRHATSNARCTMVRGMPAGQNRTVLVGVRARFMTHQHPGQLPLHFYINEFAFQLRFLFSISVLVLLQFCKYSSLLPLFRFSLTELIHFRLRTFPLSFCQLK